MRERWAGLSRLAYLGALAALSGCVSSLQLKTPESPSSATKYDVKIQRTAYGIPHISSATLEGAAYGVAYSYAQDNLCMLADHVLTVSGERSRYFGPDVGVRAGSR